MSYPTREMLQIMSENTAKRKNNQETQRFFHEYSKFKTLINIERESLSSRAFESSKKSSRITSVDSFYCSDLRSFVEFFNKKENDTGLDLIFKEVNCSVHWGWE